MHTSSHEAESREQQHGRWGQEESEEECLSPMRLKFTVGAEESFRTRRTRTQVRHVEIDHIRCPAGALGIQTEIGGVEVKSTQLRRASDPGVRPQHQEVLV